MSSPTENINGTSSPNQDRHYIPSYTGQHENRTCTPAPPMARRTPDHVYNPQAVYHRGHLPGPTYADVVQGQSGNQVPDGYFPAPAPQLEHLLPVKRTHEDDDAGDKQPTKKPMAAKKPSDAIKPKTVIPRPLPKTVKKPKIVKDDGDVGSTEYSTTELSGMVRLVLKYLPMGKKGWERVVNEYNKWASTNGYPPRQYKPFQTRWNRHQQSQLEMPTDSRCMNEFLRQRPQLLSAISSEEDDDDDDEDLVINKGKGKVRGSEGTVLTKAYKVEALLNDAPRTRMSRQSQANDLLGGISASLNPQNLQQRDVNRASMNLQMMQMQHMQTQLNNLQQRLDTATREAMEAQSELKMMRLLHSSCRRSRSRSYSRSRRSHRYSRSHSRSPTRLSHSYHHDHSTARSHVYSPVPHNIRLCSGSPRSQSPPQHRYSHLHSRIPRPFSPPVINTTISPTVTPHQNYVEAAQVYTASRTLYQNKEPTYNPPPPPTIASSSRITLDQLASIAIEELDAGDIVTVKPRSDGDYDVELSPSKRYK
ncbi:hypothetical protein F5876DRAFT_67281 [Lentinula aff. lateritia]|uniref:Uncharacterized protein n=1 Tax=Lentinula aff. lateritia TaxID=2804960 RepID=A0ACC1TUV4_9AGAR|nr:hypothetical protein F5876DRAFT_67281 [Lentinula aff. lateritia]